MAEAAALLVLAGLAAPHALPLARVTPAAACSVWIAALALRAVLVVGLALAALLLLPATELFQHVAAWSAHLRGGSGEVQLSGEPVAHLAALGPPALIALCLLTFAVRLGHAGLALRRQIARRTLGSGPGGSLVIADRALVVAVPRLGRGRIVLSDRALAELDTAELEACLAHEAGHLRRGHRALGLVGACLAELARPIPGTRAARRGVVLSLERDADEYSVAKARDPLALASAICKVAGSNGRSPCELAAYGLGGGETRTRLDGLLAGGRLRGSAAIEGGVLALAVLMPVLVAVSMLGFGLWLWDALPPASLSAAFSCPH
jgi:Zn-dependent protease with chaperone function